MRLGTAIGRYSTLISLTSVTYGLEDTAASAALSATGTSRERPHPTMPTMPRPTARRARPLVFTDIPPRRREQTLRICSRDALVAAKSSSKEGAGGPPGARLSFAPRARNRARKRSAEDFHITDFRHCVASEAAQTACHRPFRPVRLSILRSRGRGDILDDEAPSSRGVSGIGAGPLPRTLRYRRRGDRAASGRTVRSRRSGDRAA